MEYFAESGRVAHRSDWAAVVSRGSDEYRAFPLLLAGRPGSLRTFLLDLLPVPAEVDVLETLLRRATDAQPAGNVQEALDQLAGAVPRDAAAAGRGPHGGPRPRAVRRLATARRTASGSL